MTPYKRLSAYDANGDLSKEWFVKYHYLKPRHLWKGLKPEYERFRVSKTINSFHTVKERRQQLKVVMAGMKILLEEYKFNPFTEFSFEDTVSHGGYKVIHCIDQYLEEVKGELRPNTWKVYNTRLNLFKAWLAETNQSHLMIFHVTKTHVFTFLKKYQASKEWSNKTYNHYIQAISSFFLYYKDNREDYVTVNPCEKLKRLEPLKRGNRPYSDHEFHETLKYTKKFHNYLYIYLRDIYYSCFRPDAELRNLKIYEIDLPARRIAVPGEISKGKKTQWIPIDDVFYEALMEKELHKYPRDWYVYGLGNKPAAKPISEKYFNKAFKKVKTALNLHPDITMYSMKHTRAIHLVQDGVKLTDIIKLTRHQTLKELMDYLKDLGVIIGEQPDFKSRRI